MTLSIAVSLLPLEVSCHSACYPAISSQKPPGGIKRASTDLPNVVGFLVVRKFKASETPKAFRSRGRDFMQDLTMSRVFLSAYSVAVVFASLLNLTLFLFIPHDPLML
jgi:hypothetical protein